MQPGLPVSSRRHRHSRLTHDSLLLLRLLLLHSVSKPRATWAATRLACVARPLRLPSCRTC